MRPTGHASAPNTSTARTRTGGTFPTTLTPVQSLAALNPSDASTQIQLAQTAEQAGDVATAVAAYKQVIKLEPDSSDVPAIKQRIKQLQSTSSGATATSG